MTSTLTYVIMQTVREIQNNFKEETKMKKTEYAVCCGTKGRYGTPVYRVVFTDGNRLFVKWNGKLIDVTNDEDLRPRWAVGM